MAKGIFLSGKISSTYIPSESTFHATVFLCICLIWKFPDGDTPSFSFEVPGVETVTVGLSAKSHDMHDMIHSNAGCIELSRCLQQSFLHFLVFQVEKTLTVLLIILLGERVSACLPQWTGGVALLRYFLPWYSVHPSMLYCAALKEFARWQYGFFLAKVIYKDRVSLLKFI